MKCPEGHMVGAGAQGVLGPLQAVVAGHPDQALRAQACACGGGVDIILAQVHAIGPDFDGQGEVIVDDQFDVVLSTKGLQTLGRVQALMQRRSALVAVLQDPDQACSQRPTGALEQAVEVVKLRRDEVNAGGWQQWYRHGIWLPGT
jgi:hypothetical protein